MQISTADVETTHAVSYMKQLCRHWGHKFPVTFDDETGRIALPQTLCLLNASVDVLKVRLEIEEGIDQDRMERVVAEHLQRFGFREELVFPWQR